MTEAARALLDLLGAYIQGKRVDWTEVHRLRAIVAAEMGVALT